MNRKYIKNKNKPIYVYNELYKSIYTYSDNAVILENEKVLTENEVQTYLLSDPSLKLIPLNAIIPKEL